MTKDRAHKILYVPQTYEYFAVVLFIAVSNSALYLNEPHLNDYYPWLICQIDKVCIPTTEEHYRF